MPRLRTRETEAFPPRGGLEPLLLAALLLLPLLAAGGVFLAVAQLRSGVRPDSTFPVRTAEYEVWADLIRPEPPHSLRESGPAPFHGVADRTVSADDFLGDCIEDARTTLDENPERIARERAGQTRVREALEDLAAKSRHPYWIRARFPADLAVRVVSLEKLEELRAGDLYGIHDRWDAEWPGIDKAIRLSRVGFSRDGRVAVAWVSVSGGFMIGHGWFGVLRRTPAGWMRDAMFRFWMS